MQTARDPKGASPMSKLPKPSNVSNKDTELIQREPLPVKR